MKAHYKVSDRLSFEIEGDNQVEIFRQLALVDQVFSNTTCPITKNGKPSNNIIYVVRKTKDGDYFEIQCKEEPYAKLSISQHRKSPTLYPKRKDNKTGQPIGTYGWHVYNPEN
jgi:hypothetical protein